MDFFTELFNSRNSLIELQHPAYTISNLALLNRGQNEYTSACLVCISHTICAKHTIGICYVLTLDV